MWIARDCNGELRIYRTKPIKYPDMGVWISSDVIGVFINKCNAADILFSNVKWSDEEPKEIVLKNDVEKQDNLDIPEEDDYCKYHFMILKKNSDGKLFCNDCLTNCIHRKTGTSNYLVKKNSK